MNDDEPIEYERHFRHYDLNDPEGFLHAVKTGVVWQIGTQEMAQRAFDMIQAGTIDIAECNNLPDNLAAALRGDES